MYTLKWRQIFASEYLLFLISSLLSFSQTIAKSMSLARNFRYCNYNVSGRCQISEVYSNLKINLYYFLTLLKYSYYVCLNEITIKSQFASISYYLAVFFLFCTSFNNPNSLVSHSFREISRSQTYYFLNPTDFQKPSTPNSIPYSKSSPFFFCTYVFVHF